MPAAAEPVSLWSVDCVEVLPEVLPEAAPCTLVDDELLGLVVPDEEVEPLTLDCDCSLVAELALPLADGADVLPVPEGWLVCAPWSLIFTSLLEGCELLDWLDGDD